MSRVIAVDDELSDDLAEKLRKMMKVISNAMVAEYWGSIEFKFEKGKPLPNYPARESKVLYERK